MLSFADVSLLMELVGDETSKAGDEYGWWSGTSREQQPKSESF